MNVPSAIDRMFAIDGRVAVVTGGTGVLGGFLVDGLVGAGARVAVIGRRRDRLDLAVDRVRADGGEALGIVGDVTDRSSLLVARQTILEHWGRVDILVNAAGGNVAGATLDEDGSVWDLTVEAFREVVDLNLIGTLLPIQVFGEAMVGRRRGALGGASQGSIVNISSMAAGRALTRVGGYGAAKAAVESLTRWFAVELARQYGPGVRVNAITPGFLVGDQNRALLLDSTGALTTRGQTIVAHTPAGRFGRPEELTSTLLWLCGPGASFVNGVVVPIDGGFSAFSGV